MKNKFFKMVVAFVMVCAFLITTPEFLTAASLPSMPPSDYKSAGKAPAGTVKDVSYYSSATNSQRKMAIYTPPGYNSNQKYPVVYAIHGIDNTPGSIFADWGCGAAHIADILINEGKIRPLIIVAFDNNNVNTHNELFNAVMPYVEKNYSVIANADNRGIYGYSMGGGYTLAEGIGNLDVFHHVCATSPTPFNHPSNANMFPNSGAEAKAKLKTFFLNCGTADWCGFYNSTLDIHNYCAQNGIPHVWQSIPGGNHDGDVWGPAMWNFLQLAFPSDGTIIDVPPVVSPSPDPVPGDTVKLEDGTYYLKNVETGNYLTVADNKGNAGQNVVASQFTGEDGQKWTLKNLSDGYVTLTTALGDYMLDIANGADENDANIQIYHGYGGDAQQYMVKKSSTDGAYLVATKCSKLTKVVDNVVRNSNICQYTFNGDNNQKWVFEKVSSTPIDTPQPSQSTTPTSEPATPEPATPEPSTPASTQPQAGKLDVSYTINNWGSGYQVNFKIENNSDTDVSNWTVKVSKSDINISTSWNVNVEEDGEYYVITPVSWNSTIGKGGSVEFGTQGTGTIGSTIQCSVS